MIQLDGSQGEGGGQILRSALTLSMITGKAVQIENIRANRKPTPGLKAQHLACVHAAQEVANATTRGASIGSSQLRFEPDTIQEKNLNIRIGTAGSTTLVLHTIYLSLLLRSRIPIIVDIFGGTHNAHAPCLDYLQKTWVGFLKLLGLKVDILPIRPGFYPRGRGNFQATIHPAVDIKPLQCQASTLPDVIRIRSAVAGLPVSIAERMNHRLEQRWKKAKFEVETEVEEWENGPGVVMIAEVETGGVPAIFFELGERGKHGDKVADDLAVQVESFIETNAPIDPHSADQLLLPLSFANGISEFRTSSLTQHLFTNADTIELFGVAKFEIEGELDQPGLVRVIPKPRDGSAGAN
jgi:RNA 3'-phosphate cyclase